MIGHACAPHIEWGGAKDSHRGGVFRSDLPRAFLVPADTFDNVKGQFPILFSIWDTAKTKRPFTECLAHVYSGQGEPIGTKRIAANDATERITKWLSQLNGKGLPSLGYLLNGRSDMQHQELVHIVNGCQAHFKHTGVDITLVNLTRVAIYLSVRHAIRHTWLNDRDQLLWPRDGWREDGAFQSDCLACTLFHPQNRIMRGEGANHWIPFTEEEVGAHGLFESRFMTDYMAGRLGHGAQDLFGQGEVPSETMRFTPEATALFDAGRALWRYYHAQPGAIVDASLYDIRAHFQGRNARGVMNPRSDDAEYMQRLAELRQALEALRRRIEPKVYEYGFMLG